MRPRRLEIAALGPFGAREVVDFDALDGDLFLIHGPTGAGKSTILDAMCYALYGVVPGVRQERPHELRSAHADAHTECEVVFDFSLGQKTYRVKRAPEQPRPKRRGQGVTAAAARAQLYQLRANNEVPECMPKIHDVDQRLRDLLGLDVHQFKQVLLLPQGEFREFLLAPSDKKEALLEKLFGTTIYKEVAETLRAQKLHLEQLAGEANRLRAEHLQQGGVRSTEELANAIAKADSVVAEQSVHAQAADQAHGAARAALESGRKLAEDFALHESLVAKWNSLNGHRQTIERKKAQLERAAKVDPLAPLIERQSIESGRLQKQKIEFAQSKKDLAASVREKNKIDAAAEKNPDLEKDIDTIGKRLAGLEPLEGIESRARELAAQLAVAQKARDTAIKRAKRCALVAAKLGEQCDALDGRAARAHKQAASAMKLGSAANRAENRANKAKHYADLTDELTDGDKETVLVQQALLHKKKACHAARVRLESTQKKREHGLAAELADGLIDAEPCPVCGSCDHPSPAASVAKPITPAAIDKAQHALEAALSAVSDTEAQAAALKRRAGQIKKALGVLKKSLGKDPNVKKIIAGAKKALSLSKAAASAADQAVRLDSDRRQRAHEQRSAESMLRKSEREREKHEKAVPVAQAKHESLIERLRVHVSAGESVAKVASRLRQKHKSLQKELAARCKRQRAARDALARAEARFEKVQGSLREQEMCVAQGQAELDSQCKKHGFAGVQAARRALLPPDDRRRFQRDVLEFSRTCAANEKRRSELSVVLDGKTMPDVAVLTNKADSAKRAALDSQRQLGSEQTALSSLRQRQTRVAQLGDEYKAHEQKLRVLGTLADVVWGNNPRKMSLQRFVLASRMDEIAIAASERLFRMSRGRYVLQRTEGVVRGRRSGLDLLVEDRQTGATRSVQSLSGGEMFMASLSLALGLADVVTQRSGGVHLDALFIDEGFGSLDDETLDLVMRALEDLRANGRLIGLISHVTELRDRIPLRLSVEKGPHGARIGKNAVAAL